MASGLSIRFVGWVKVLRVIG